MRTLTLEDSLGVTWVTLSSGRIVGRLLMVGGMLTAVIALQYAAPGAPGYTAVVMVAFSLAKPDSHVPSFGLGLFALEWLRFVTDEATLAAIPAALGLLTFHLAAAFTASGPPGQVADRRTVVRWVFDAGWLVTLTCVLWLVVALGEDSLEGTRPYVAATLLAVAAFAWWLRQGLQRSAAAPAGPWTAGAARAPARHEQARHHHDR